MTANYFKRGSEKILRKGPLLADPFEKFGFSDHLNSGTTAIEEPTHHIEWFLGPSLTFAALLLASERFLA
ncbi:hypothetical protein [Pseudomonas sp. CLCA07]